MIRKVFLSTLNTRYPQRGMEHAFRGIFGNENVDVFDPMERRRAKIPDDVISEEFVDAVVRHQPDWTWLQFQDSGALSTLAIMEARKQLPRCVFTHFMGDLRETIGPHLAQLCRSTHLTMVSNQGQLQMFLDVGAPRVQYCPIAADWEEDILGEPDWEPPFRVPDVVFCGSNYGETFPGTKEREEAARALMASGLDFGIVGKGWSKEFPVVGRCERRQQSSVYRRSKVILSVNNFNAIRRYYSNRLWVALASGKPVVCHSVPGIEEDLSDEGNCVIYTTADELTTEVGRLLSDPERRDRLGFSGRALVFARHTWFQRVLQVTGRVERIQAELGGGA